MNQQTSQVPFINGEQQTLNSQLIRVLFSKKKITTIGDFLDFMKGFNEGKINEERISEDEKNY